jgi:hypothetical protein
MIRNIPFLIFLAGCMVGGKISDDKPTVWKQAYTGSSTKKNCDGSNSSHYSDWRKGQEPNLA